MNLFDIPTIEAPYMPEDEMWLMPADLSEQFKRWGSLSRWRRFLLMWRFKKAVRENRAAIYKVDTLEDEVVPIRKVR